MLTAISLPNRIRILNVIKQENMLCGCEMLPMLGLEQSNLSRQLSTLIRVGIIVAGKDGVKMNYKIVDEKIFVLINLTKKIVLAKFMTIKSEVAYKFFN